MALVHLEAALTFSESIQPIGLPAPGAEPAGNASLSGWGSTINLPIPLPATVLQYVDIPILSYEGEFIPLLMTKKLTNFAFSECASALTDLFGDPEPLDETSNVCTGPLYDGISACSGDSGGPLAQQDTNEIVGIVSWGITPCGYDGAPSVFTKVSSFVDFISVNVPDLPSA